MVRLFAFAMFFLFGFCATAQNAFSLPDSVVRLYKDTDASPVHWYAEILNMDSVDTTLRWKVVYSNTWPSSWKLNFDDQNNFYPNLKDGDSADFVLYGNLSFPQKLIIGNNLNNTIGVDSVDFLIYHPGKPSEAKVQRYVFYIEKGQHFYTSEEIRSKVYLNRSSNQLGGLDEFKGFYQLVNLDGRVVQHGKLPQHQIQLPHSLSQLFILQLFPSSAVNQQVINIKLSF